MTQNRIEKSEGATVFAGPLAVRIVQATAVAAALRLYARTKMQANRAYTPAAMLRTAGDITGKTYKRGQYVQAADDLKAWADKTAAEIHEANVTS